MDKPQIIAHVQKSMNFTLYDCRWVPCSAKFVVLGNHARGTGALQIYELAHGDVTLVHEVRCAAIWPPQSSTKWQFCQDLLGSVLVCSSHGSLVTSADTVVS